MRLIFEKIRRKCTVKLAVCLFMVFGFMAYFLLQDDGKKTEALLSFTQLMNGFKITVILIDPPMLYNRLSAKRKTLLKSRGFNISSHATSGTIVRFALIGDTSAIRIMAESKFDDVSKDRGFHHEIVPDQIDGNISFAHHFFKGSNLVIHAMHFQDKGKFYLCRNISVMPPLLNVTPAVFQFYRHDRAYEKFSVRYLEMEKDRILIIPADIMAFLHQLKSSRFLKCLGHSFHTGINKKNYRKIVNSFKTSLGVLKAKLQPRLIDFFLFGGTILGWYRQCDIIPYTTDVDFGAWSTDVGDQNFWIRTFKGHSRLRLCSTMGLPDEAFELRFRVEKMVDLFFLYEDGNTMWMAGHVPSKGLYYRYVYPNFDLCSADLLGYKVLVPCEPLKIILAEYGPQWNKTITSWNYASSPKNLSPAIYWSEDKRKQTYKIFY